MYGRRTYDDVLGHSYIVRTEALSGSTVERIFLRTVDRNYTSLLREKESTSG